ncbi:CBS domain-containing protein, partial [Anabaena sp. UHCC 0253]
TAADAVNNDSPIVKANLSLREFADQRLLNAQEYRRYLVTDEQGQLLGAISVDDLRTIPNTLWAETQVLKVMKPIEQSSTVQSDQPLLEVVQLLETQKLSALTVIRDNGLLVGILEKAAIINLLQNKVQAKFA